MNEPQYVEVTDPGHAAEVNRWIGMVEVQVALRDVPDFQKVPGFGLALAIVDREVASQRSIGITRNLKAIAAAGIDITKIATVEFESTKLGAARLKVTMMDLADLAGGGSNG